MIASYDFSHDLKHSGFPQPEPQSGQFWYDRYRNLSVLSLVGRSPGAESKIMVLILDSEDTYETVPEEMGGFVFAPTDSDILKEREDWCLTFYGGKYVVIEFDTRNKKSKYLENSADALAEAYLSYLSI